MNKINLSIIVPHFNSCSSLLKLLSTIPERQDWEIIVIDDNSTDSTTSVEQFINERPSITLFKNNSGYKGAGACRNIGLSHAKGEWLLFADADDFFLPNFQEIILNCINENADIIYFPPTSMDVKTGNVSARHKALVEFVENYRTNESLKTLTALKYSYISPWSKLIQARLFKENNILFDPIMVSNDVMAITKCAYYSEKILAKEDVIYCVTRSGNSLTAVKNEAWFDQRVLVLVDRYTFLKEHLSKKEFYYAHINHMALGKITSAILEHWGIKKVYWILCLYKKNGIHCFDIGLLNPIVLFHKLKNGVSWWFDIKKNRN